MNQKDYLFSCIGDEEDRVIINNRGMMKLDFDERIELFQQLEIAQGIRRGEKSIKALSTVSQQILRKYESLPSEREKTVFAERVKNQVFSSLKKSITEDKNNH